MLSTNDGHSVCAAYGYDANGNVTVLAAGGNADPFVLASSLEYDPFGRVVAHRADPGHEPLAAANRYRFSTKWQDPLTRLSDYGYCWYDAERGRWLTRDPIEESGNKNLYCFVENRTVSRVDRYGLASVDCCKQEDIDNIIAKDPWASAIADLRAKRNIDGRACLSTIKCGKCEGSGDGEYCPPYTDSRHPQRNRSGSITICSKVTEDILRHELQHADQCDGLSCGGPYPTIAQCIDALCVEIAAYICGDKGTGGACDKTSPTYNQDACIRRAWQNSVGGKGGNTLSAPCPNCNRYLQPDGSPPSAANCNFNPTCVIP